MSKLREELQKERTLRGIEVTKWLIDRGIDDYDTFTSAELDETICDALEHFLKDFVAKEDLREKVEKKIKERRKEIERIQDGGGYWSRMEIVSELRSEVKGMETVLNLLK